MKTLDSLALDPADLVKFDVEGMELEVLNGAKSLLAASSYPPILFKLWGISRHPWYAAKRKATIDWMTEHHYHVQIFDELCVAQHPSQGPMVHFEIRDDKLIHRMGDAP